MEKKILIETLGEIIFNPATKTSEKHVGRRIVCSPSLVFDSATRKPITAQQIYKNMSSIPDRREFLILGEECSDVIHPEEYRQCNTDIKKRVIAQVLRATEICENEWQLLERYSSSKR